jgi:hypothetical protein
MDLTRIKHTMSLDISRSMSAGLPPKAIVEVLLNIPEVEQAFHLRENRNRPLAVDPETDAERKEIVEAIERVAVWLECSDADLAEQLRMRVAMLTDGGASVD